MSSSSMQTQTRRNVSILIFSLFFFSGKPQKRKTESEFDVTDNSDYQYDDNYDYSDEEEYTSDDVPRDQEITIILLAWLRDKDGQ